LEAGETLTQDAKQAVVSRLYDRLYDMAVSFELKPGERINEVDLARRLGASRTPLREALNRLASEGFLRFETGRGFFCRNFQPKEILELYQIREALESFAVRAACENATEAQLAALDDFLDRTGPGEQGRSSAALVTLDEEFHETLMSYTGNAEMLKLLRNINARVRFVRWVRMEARRGRTQQEHRMILEAIRLRDPEWANRLMAEHIDRRLDEIAAAVREAHARIFIDGGTDGRELLQDGAR
jgi:DNA-binding GntR family transcriptional regulator